MKLREAYRLMFQEYPDVVSVAELQSMLGVGQKAAYRLLHNGSIGYLKTGRKFRIPKANVIQYVTATHTN